MRIATTSRPRILPLPLEGAGSGEAALFLLFLRHGNSLSRLLFLSATQDPGQFHELLHAHGLGADIIFKPGA